MRQLGKIAAVQAIVFLCGLVAIEYALAWFAPLPPHGGVYTDRNGKPARVSRDDDMLVPNLDLIHSASEFSAGIHTDARGYRLMSRESATPDFLFVGDSFTFGHGVSDDEVFAEVFCKARGATCPSRPVRDPLSTRSASCVTGSTRIGSAPGPWC